MSNELKFLLGGLLGFGLGVPAGIIQADVGPEPHPPQHPVGHRPPRPRGDPRRADHDPLRGHLHPLPHPDQRGQALQPEAGQRPLLGPPRRRHRHGGVHGHGRPEGHAAPDDLHERRVRDLHDPGGPLRGPAPARLPLVLPQHRHERRLEGRAGHLREIERSTRTSSSRPRNRLRAGLRASSD
ncbi:MAG: hypothetical protein MZU84_08495 [Sphingobacterium sp.]|nr:hypothetical protein [Sphingobacterium sp.]